ncbi:hypothetical protein QBC46DRAFT_398580 [Diplogelasinospora grovesii]|uniref:Nascent polypeptide-associated complex subunit alpha-like UBA domain-containing protein n=1 Tax=Diplogelasinospora grovesii TaxID=303347 RepID=A0AAN6RYV4_9PEZI|nr:hypothetical protein QBC46DRAFT_398580 [Diplogelasinospora grovesii]
MAEDKQPQTVVEGATGGDVEDEVVNSTAKSAEDRKAAAALSKLDTHDDDESGRQMVDQDALNNVMEGVVVPKRDDEAPRKVVKVDPADVALLVDELELPKTKATELLRSHDGDAVKAMRAFITPSWKA